MNWMSILVWGFCASAAMAVTESGGLWLGLTRMNTPIILGSIVSGDRDKAALIGTILHLSVGCVFAIGYAFAFRAAGTSAWWLGLALGVGHSLFVLGVVLPSVPAVHSRMASSRAGPGESALLQAPGFLALNYGRRTVLVSIVAHAVFGVLLALLYQLPG